MGWRTPWLPLFLEMSWTIFLCCTPANPQFSIVPQKTYHYPHLSSYMLCGLRMYEETATLPILKHASYIDKISGVRNRGLSASPVSVGQGPGSEFGIDTSVLLASQPHHTASHLPHSHGTALTVPRTLFLPRITVKSVVPTGMLLRGKDTIIIPQQQA